MGKKAEQNKLTSGHHGIQLEHNTVYDDSLLPSAAELERLHKINPEILPWIMARAEVEQNARIAHNRKRTALIGREVNFAGWSTLIGLVMCFVLIGAFIYLSYQLFVQGHAVWGGIFGGIDLVALVSILTKFQLRSGNK